MTSDVEFRNVSKFFGASAAVDDISFSVPAGSFFSLLGPSGCGKSTTLRMTSGFEFPDRGDILIAGENMAGIAAYRRPTNMVFQRWALFPHMTVFDNIAFGLSVERQPRDVIHRRVGEALELVGLTQFATRKPRQLSGGQMQRVALARALVKRPKVLLLDEPLGALDLKLRMQMQLELKRIQREVGTTFIYVTHDQGEALTMSDQIAVMHNGRIDQLGSPQEIYDHPATRFVAGFIGNANLLPVAVADRGGGTATVSLDGFTFPTHIAQEPTGDRGWIVIRYERIRMGKAAGSMPIRTQARVRDAIFAGSTVHYVMAIEPSGTEITVEAGHDGLSSPLTQGSLVDIGWEPGVTRLFGDV
ncbi:MULTISPECIES: ABC transporter ATP-binding protein [unclassified Chelatococcus]|uniref:ABC transporter ATP-binding protein n=1 Tax=unclassified Chelatococcus TaxID=2638111 RepID=UPI001BCD7D1B|nr:ABC transporter ATP-binding protein [Chelatococcus sp.]MBS7699750.1 ABC transporter ATP-binding protein [Chelatococcus sp. YT9]MBX3558096.1 ABC transporter ATP-binding protein [Chelatococcus sp.]